VNIVILNWQRPLWEGDQEVVKRSSRDEPMWVVIHLSMEVMLGISLYNYLYLKLAKYFLFNKSENKRAEQVLPRSRVWEGWERRWGEVAQTMYTYVSKCKNGEIFKKILKTGVSSTVHYDLPLSHHSSCLCKELELQRPGTSSVTSFPK
jgi:hypothetical protein